MILRLILLNFFGLLFIGCVDPKSEREKYSHHIIAEFAKQMQKDDLYVAGYGGGCTVEKKTNLVDVSFDYDGIMNIESSRALIVACINNLLNIINSNLESKNYFVKFPVTIELINVSIIGRSQNNMNNYIKMVMVLKDRVYYYIDDPEKKIMPFMKVHEETFEEAERNSKNAKINT